MPGLNQLKQFSNDIESLGDEVRIRTARGEKPSFLPLPQGISEADDSDDFIGGLPRQDADPADAATTDDMLADDLSAAVPGETSEPPAADNPLPDLDFLNIGGGAMGDELPDLSDFLDEPVEPAPQTAAEPSAAEREPAASPDDSDGLFASSGGGIADAEDIPSVDDLLATLDLPDDATFADDTKLTLPDELQAHDISLADAFVPETGVELTESPAPAAEEPADEDLPPADLDEPQTETGEPQAEADEPQAEAAHEPDDTAAPAPSEDFALTDDVPTEDAPMPPEAGSADATAESLFDLSDLDDLPPPDDISAPDDMPASDGDAAADDDISDVFDTSALDFPDMPSDSPTGDISDAAAESVPEVFDTSEMEGLDFSADASTPVSFDDIPVTGELPAGDDGFELTDDFEIPGFSDTDTVPVEKKKGGGFGAPDSSKANSDRPPNTLTEREFEQFKKNLAAYPLNLRIAVEDFIVKDEFKDNVIFEVVEKVLKKVPARQLAGHMEKLLDIAIDVPRDYERRSVAEYEAYKQSFQYQLKNRILPMAIMGIVACIFAVFLFQAGKMFVYRPLKALSYYKQGYTMLENNEFPQSEERFAAAVSYKPMKKWFFKYARGYRDRKQYERAAQMYRNILYFFKHDKQAGLEYARMELYDRANYPRAEEIVRRDVLDYYINDADGLLLLGDIFLEWAEIDPGKYEDAREQYANLIQLYGQTDLYMSRMMRYFIRTDNLQNVLVLKNRFYANKKSKKALGAQDWTELSGYLLDKLYGTLSKSEEFLRSSIEDVLDMLNMAVRLDPANPVARYNLSRYFLHNNNDSSAQREMQIALDLFASAPVRTKKNTYREINGSRILGELFAEKREYLKAQEAYTRGINVFSEEHGRTGLEGDENTGHLFADVGDIDYFISGDMDSALANYQMAVATKYDIPSLNYRIGAIHYNRKQFDKALGSFVKTAETEGNDVNLLLSLGNTLSLRGDNFAAQGYYADLLNRLNDVRARDEMLFPQEHAGDNELVDMYLKANNNLGVTLYRLARQTGNSGMNAEALVRLSDSMRAWDALTRNPTTMKRLEGGNLALQNAKYLMHPYAEFEPAIYTDIPKTLSGEKVLE
ncbi:MAG: hypothetical protein K2N31_01315 [Treponemataceae bacterium]|nr:hypothetical protein [Treponemataceae bacterium]